MVDGTASTSTATDNNNNNDKNNDKTIEIESNESFNNNSNSNSNSSNNNSTITTPPPKVPSRSGRHGARNERRHKNLTKWLLDRFGLRPGDTVLDVAGGKGELAARLSLCHGIQVIMVDPRPARVLECYESVVLPKLPNKWQRRVAMRKATEGAEFLQELLDSRFRQLVMCMDEGTLSTCTELGEAIEKSRLLVGMHADGATEAIVDAALRYRKPFVVVPCCVFPRLFPQRTVREEETGRHVQVRSHEQFCRYLVDKHPGFRIETLPFEGRNVGIWWDGQSDGHEKSVETVPDEI